jgi:uncharacterized protein YjgD (DUF1641 family)
MNLTINNVEVNTTQELLKKVQESQDRIDRIEKIVSKIKFVPERQCLVSFMFNDNVISKKVSLSDIEENMRQLLNRIPEFKIPYIQDNVEYFEFNANPIWDIKDSIENDNSEKDVFIIKGPEIRYIVPQKNSNPSRSRNIIPKWEYMKDDFSIVINVLPMSEDSYKLAKEKQFADIKEALLAAKLIDSNGEVII